MRYLETAKEIREDVKELIETMLPPTMPRGDKMEIAVKIGHIVNLAVRSCPRGVQHTVRRNIVEEAVKDYCRVGMEEHRDIATGSTYHVINITPKG